MAVVEDRHPLNPPHHHGMEGVRSLEAELAQHGDAHSITRRRKMLRPVFQVLALRRSAVGGADRLERLVGQPPSLELVVSRVCPASFPGVRLSP